MNDRLTNTVVENLPLAQALHEQQAYAAYTAPGYFTNEKAIAPYLERKARAVALLAELERLREFEWMYKELSK